MAIWVAPTILSVGTIVGTLNVRVANPGPPMNHYLSGLVPLAAGLVSLLLGLWVVARNPRSSSARAFCLLAATTALWTVSEGLIRTAPSPEVASAWALPQYLGVLFLPPALYAFLRIFPRAEPSRPIGVLLTLLLSVVLAAALVASTPLAVQGQWWGYAVDASAAPIAALASLYLIVSMVAAVPLALSKLRRLRLEVEVRQLRWYLIGLVPTLVVGLVTDALQPLLLGAAPALVPPLAAPMTFWLAGATAWGILRYEALLVTPVDEAVVVEGECEQTARGYVYLVNRADRAIAERLFVSAIAGGAQGLAITTEEADAFRARTALRTTPVVCVLDAPAAPADRRAGRHSLERAFVMAEAFLAQSTNPIILSDVGPAVVGSDTPDGPMQAEALQLLVGLQQRVDAVGGRLVVVLSTPLVGASGAKVVRTRHVQGFLQGPVVHQTLAQALGALLSLVERACGAATARACWERLTQEIETLQRADAVRHTDGRIALSPQQPLDWPGLLSCLRKAVTLVEAQTGRPWAQPLLVRLEELGIERYEYLLVEGRAYLIQTSDRAEMVSLARLLVAMEHPTLAISRSAAGEFATLGATARSLTPGDPSVPMLKPGLEHLLAEVRTFLEGHAPSERCVVVLDGLDYLINQGDSTRDNFPRVLTFLRRASELVASHKGVLLLPLQEGAIDEGRLAKVRAEFPSLPLLDASSPAGSGGPRRLFRAWPV